MPAGGAAEPAAAASDSKEEHSPLLQTPRSVSDFAASLRSEGARATSPFGRDFEELEFGSKLGAPECLRRLLCLRFDVGYVTLPMTNGKIMAYVQTKAQAGSGASEPAAGLDVEMLASILEETAKVTRWLRCLLTAYGKKHLQPVDTQLVAENFASFVSEHELSDSIAAMSRGHLVVAAIWLSYLLLQKGCGVRRPSDATALMLQKPSYIPVEAVGPSGEKEKDKRGGASM